MAASASDLLQEVGLPGSATNLAGSGYTIGGSSITVTSTTNWPTATGLTFAIDRAEVIDGETVRIDGTYCEFVGTVASSTSITNVSKAFGPDQDYPAGSLTRVYIPVSSERENRIVQWGTAQHKQDGTHDDITATSINVSGSVTLPAGSTSALALTNPYKFSAYRNGAQNLTASTSTKIQFETESYDTGSNYDNATNFRFTAPVAGFYRFNAQALVGMQSGNTYYIFLAKNGAEVRRGDQLSANATTGVSIGVEATLQLAANDYIEVFAFNGAGTSALTVGPAFVYFDGELRSKS